MIVNEKYSLKRLEDEGWKFVTNFGNCQVFGKELTRCLWNPITGIIQHIFNDCQYI